MRGWPVVGPIVFGHDVLVYASWLCVLLVSLYLTRTRPGLNLRAVGESPAAADAMGIDVIAYRYAHTLVGGALAGVGGATFTLALTPQWINGITGGAGWIAIALVIFAFWRPELCLVGAFLRRSAGALAATPGAGDPPRPDRALDDSLPYVMTIVVLVLARRAARGAGSARLPASACRTCARSADRAGGPRVLEIAAVAAYPPAVRSSRGGRSHPSPSGCPVRRGVFRARARRVRLSRRVADAVERQKTRRRLGRRGSPGHVAAADRPRAGSAAARHRKKEKEPKKGPPVPGQSATPDPVVQDAAGTAAAPALGVGFDGVGNGFTGPSGTFTVDSAPPDTNGGRRPEPLRRDRQQASRSSTRPARRSTARCRRTRSGAASAAAARRNNDGDATVAYDRLAEPLDDQPVLGLDDAVPPVRRRLDDRRPDRRVLPLLVPVRDDFPDYPKLGVWPDAYYIDLQHVPRTARTFLGPEVCAYDRAKMLAGPAGDAAVLHASSTQLRRPAALRPRRRDAAAGRRAELRRSSFGTNSARTSGSSTSTGRRRRTRRFTGPTTHPRRLLHARVLRRRHVHPADGHDAASSTRSPTG